MLIFGLSKLDIDFGFLGFGLLGNFSSDWKRKEEEAKRRQGGGRGLWN